MQTVLGHAVIIPRLPEFMERYPGLEISLGASDNLNDLVADGIDCSVRLGELDDSSLVAKRIGEVALGCFSDLRSSRVREEAWFTRHAG